MEIEFKGSLVEGWTTKETDAEGKETGKEIKHDPIFTGSVTVKVPPYPIRARFPKELGIQDLSSADDDATQKEKIAAQLGNLEVLAKAAEMMEKYIVGVDLKEIKTGKELKTVDDFYCYPAASSMITELAGEFIRGFQPKN